MDWMAEYYGGGKKLFKSSRDRMVDGVCAGIAEFFGVDPMWIRLDLSWYLPYRQAESLVEMRLKTSPRR